MNIFNNTGQTLVTLLVFTVVAIAVASTAVAVMINITRSASIIERRTIVSQAAESGIENAIIRLLRDPDYAGETLLIGDTSVEVTIAGSDPIMITAKASQGNYIQTVQASTAYVDNSLTVSHWEYLY